MSEYVLSCCSTADLSKEHFQRRNISYVCFHFNLDGQDYADDLGESISFADFYQKMREGADTRTSQVNVGEYLEYFRQFLEQGKDIVHLCLSSGISNTYSSACTAADTLREKYPERKIHVIDSLAASSGYGLLMDKLADLRDDGMDVDTLAAWAQEHKLEVQHWFFTTDLTYLVRGGRVSKAAGFFGGVMNICPLLNVDFMGRLIARAKVRGKAKVITETVDRMEKYAAGQLGYADKCYISMSDCMEDARAVADLVEKKFPRLKGRVEINWIGTTIGSHTGPGTVALFFWGAKRDN